jgi:hypothetical protein
MNADGSNVVQLTNEPGFDIDPSFSGTGKKIAFRSNRDGNFEIYSMNPDGTGQTRLTNNTVTDLHPDFSPNGKAIVFATQVPGSAGPRPQIAIMSAAGLFPTVLTAAGANIDPAFSGDGKRIFFHSTRDQNNIEIYSMAIDGSDETRLTNNLFLDTMPDSQRLLHVETIGVYRPATGQWHLRNTNTPGPADLILTLGGQPGDLPVAGNWNGDQRTDIGIFRNGTFLLGNVHSAVGFTFIEQLPPIAFGQPGDLPVAGDWNGDGIDDVGVFRPGIPGKFILRLPGGSGSGGGIFPLPTFPSITFNFGTLGDFPVAGDWDGDGVETVGLFRPGNGGDNATFLLTNDFNGTPELTFALGTLGNLPLAGDWLGVGNDDIGIFLDLLPGMLLSVDGKVTFSVTFGQVGDFPVAGNWTP